MRSKFSIGLTAVSTIFAAVLFMTGTLAIAQEKILHSYDPTHGDGQLPNAGLIFDAAGNLYGATGSGGAYSYYGAVFELSPAVGGGWTETVLHSFNSNDGNNPAGTLIFDAAGNLYGTTAQGGAHGGGEVFELSPGSGGMWTASVLHAFGNGHDASYPLAGLVFDGAGIFTEPPWQEASTASGRFSSCRLPWEAAGPRKCCTASVMEVTDSILSRP